MAQTIIAVVDEDERERLSTCELVAQAGYGVKSFNTSEEFLAAVMSERASCILLDLQLPGLDGIAALRELYQAGHSPPVIVITGYDGVAAAVEAMKLGAHDYIERPYPAKVLIAAIHKAVASAQVTERAWSSQSKAAALVETLSPREREVLKSVVKGLRSKTIAYELGLSVRTVEAYRSHVMTKLHVGNVGGAIRVATAAGIQLT